MNAPIVKYRTNYLADKIKAIEIVRETEKSVFYLLGTREAKASKTAEFHRYHDTWADAHAYLIAKAEREVISARRALEVANGKFGNIKGMKPPKEST